MVSSNGEEEEEARNIDDIAPLDKWNEATY